MHTTVILLLYSITAHSGINTSNSNHLKKEIESIESIREKSEVFVKNAFSSSNKSLKIEIGKLDHRLHLKKCPFELTFFFPHDNKKLGNNTIGVSCESKPAWTIYIPIKVSAERTVIKATKTIKKGEKISNENIDIKTEIVSNESKRGISSKKDVLGKIALKHIFKGNTLTKFNVGSPDLIVKNQTIFAKIKNRGISIQASVKALQNGKKGDRIKALNEKSGRVIEGIVIDSNTIIVGH